MATQWQDVPRHCDVTSILWRILSWPGPQGCMLAWLAAETRPIAYTPHNGGHWIIFSHALAHKVLCDARNFGSFPIGVPANYQQRPRLIPLESGPDEHRRYRRCCYLFFSQQWFRKWKRRSGSRPVRCWIRPLPSHLSIFLPR